MRVDPVPYQLRLLHRVDLWRQRAGLDTERPASSAMRGSVWLLAMMLSTRACAGARWSCMPNLWCGDSEHVTPGFQSMTVYAALG